VYNTDAEFINTTEIGNCGMLESKQLE